MCRSLLATLICAFAALGAAARATEPEPAAKPGPVMAGVARRANDIADAVLSHHIDPPARQQMILDGLKGVHKAAGVPPPAELARRVSALAAPDQLAAMLAETWPHAAKKGVKDDELIGTFLGSMLAGIPGAELIPAKDLKVAEQIEGNLYVGIHISISYDEAAKRPVIGQVLEGGPAYRAGAHDGDRIEEIDGVSTEGTSLREAVDRLRGAEGTEVVVRLRDKASGEVRRLTMTRGRMPRPTVSGVRKRSDGTWVFRLDGPDAIGYLRVDDISGSTPQEFRQIAPRLEAEGIRALILDLRGLSQTGLHPTVLLADSLLDGGTIGRVRTAGSVEVYEAEPDALFRGWPLAVLVDGPTSGAAGWLCAALQDNHRAVIVGTQIGSDAEVHSSVTLPGGDLAVRLTVGRLERADGRPLAGPSPPILKTGKILSLRPHSTPGVGGGITPDVTVVVPGRPGPGRPPRGPATPEPKDLANDEFVAKARERLARDLKSTGI